MALTIKKAQDPDQPEDGSLLADRRLWLTAGGIRVVEDGDPAAAFLLVAPGQRIPRAAVTRLGLVVASGGAVVQSSDLKQAAPAEDKQAAPAANKAARTLRRRAARPPANPEAKPPSGE